MTFGYVTLTLFANFVMLLRRNKSTPKSPLPVREQGPLCNKITRGYKSLPAKCYFIPANGFDRRTDRQTDILRYVAILDITDAFSHAA